MPPAGWCGVIGRAARKDKQVENASAVASPLVIGYSRKPTMAPRIFLLLFLLPAASCAPENTVRTMDATVTANKYGHDFTPVSLELEWTPDMRAPVCVRGEGFESPGQFETLSKAGARLWWMANLPAGSETRFTLEFGRDCSAGAFQWRAAGDSATDLLHLDRPVLQYVHPVYDPDDIDGTRRPFHHVYDSSGLRHITKGAGGLYSHHRGIFFGYNQILVGDSEERIDIWHSNEGERQQHHEVLDVYEGPVLGGHSLRILWNDLRGQSFAEEIRDVRAFLQPTGRILIDFRSQLRSLAGRVRLDGDRQHAGVQFRAAQEVAENEEATRFLRPQGWEHLPEDQEFNDELHVDLPWNAMRFPLDQQSFTVAYLSHPSNPAGAEMSERRYGRFGEFFPYIIDSDEPLEVRYRFWIVENSDPTRQDIEKLFQDFARPPAAAR
jgi:hypothetical protein